MLVQISSVNAVKPLHVVAVLQVSRTEKAPLSDHGVKIVTEVKVVLISGSLASEHSLLETMRMLNEAEK